jgi:hypothetical protein
MMGFGVHEVLLEARIAILSNALFHVHTRP